MWRQLIVKEWGWPAARWSVSLAIRDLKGARPVSPTPTIRAVLGQRRLARSITTLAHNLYRWIPRTSAESNHPTNSPPEPPSATGYSAYPHGWSTTADDTSCAYPPNGPGPTPTKPPSPTSATYPNSPDRHPHNHTTPPLNQPLRNRTPTRPDTPPKYPRPSTPNPTTPPNPHQPPTNPQNNH